MLLKENAATSCAMGQEPERIAKNPEVLEAFHTKKTGGDSMIENLTEKKKKKKNSRSFHSSAQI